MDRKGDLVRGTVLAVLAFAAVPLTVMSVAKVVGYQPLIVRGGSMGQAVPKGAIAAARWAPRDVIAIGDIVMVNEGRMPFIHRVTDVKRHPSGIRVRTQGDANAKEDPRPWNLPERVLRVAWHIPYLGYVAGFAASKMGLMLIIVVIPTLVFLGLLTQAPLAQRRADS